MWDEGIVTAVAAVVKKVAVAEGIMVHEVSVVAAVVHKVAVDGVEVAMVHEVAVVAAVVAEVAADGVEFVRYVVLKDVRTLLSRKEEYAKGMVVVTLVRNVLVKDVLTKLRKAWECVTNMVQREDFVVQKDVLTKL